LDSQSQLITHHHEEIDMSYIAQTQAEMEEDDRAMDSAVQHAEYDESVRVSAFKLRRDDASEASERRESAQRAQIARANAIATRKIAEWHAAEQQLVIRARVRPMARG
jgi:hypothetical protein